MVKKAIKGKKVDLSNLVANNKSHIPDRPVERAEGESGFFRRDYQDRDRLTYRSEGDDNWQKAASAPSDPSWIAYIIARK